MQRGELFAQPSLVVDGRRYRAGDGKRPGTFRISRGTRGIRFDWLQPGGAHSVRLGYRLALFGTAYTDVVDLGVPVWEERLAGARGRAHGGSEPAARPAGADHRVGEPRSPRTTTSRRRESRSDCRLLETSTRRRR